MTEAKPDDREAKYLAMSAAEFKLDEARFFLQKAADSAKSPREFRFYLDAALDAICGARDVAKEAASLDPILRKTFERDELGKFNAEESTNLVINKGRVGAHHRAGRATLQPIIETGQTETGQTLIRDINLDDHVEFLVLIRPEMSPNEQRITWTFVEGDHRYRALDVCYEVIKELAELLAGLRTKLDLGPDRGLKKLGMRFLKAMPEMQKPIPS